MGNGIEQTGVIDIVAHDERTGEVALIMIEPRPWDGSEERLFQLQEKINVYLSFALDGEMIEAYPAFAGKPVRLQLDCVAAPDLPTGRFLRIVEEQIGFQQIRLVVNVRTADDLSRLATPAAPPGDLSEGPG